MGAEKGLIVTGSPPIAVITGVLTATFGGILRDMLAGEPSVLLRPEIYVTAALAGRRHLCLSRPCGDAGAGSRRPPPSSPALAVRGGAMRYGWTFPPYQARPGRRPEDIL